MFPPQAFPPAWYETPETDALGPDPLEMAAPVPSMPAIQTPKPPPAWLSVLPLVFAGIAGAKGHMAAGTGALQGFQQGQLLEDQRRQQMVREQERQQAFQIQQQRATAYAQQATAQRDQIAQRAKDTELKAAIDDIRAQKFPSKKAYDAAVDAHEARLQLRAGTLRRLVPYNGPSAQSKAAEAVNALIKTHGPEVMTSGAMIDLDRDDDGIPERLSITDAAKLAGIPFLVDQAGDPMLPPKPVKPENVQDFDVVFRGLVEKFTTEKGRPPSTAEQGDLALKAAESLSKFRKEGVVAATPSQQLSPSGLDPRTQARVDNLSTGFRNDPTVKRANVMAEAMSFVSSLSDTSDNPGDDQALIYAFAKAMDPDSVVREGEYKTVQTYSQSWLEQFGFNAQRVVSNTEFLSPQVRRQLKATIRARYNATRAQYENIRKQFSKQIGQATGRPNGDDFLLDYAAAFPAADERPTGHEQTPYSVGQVVTVKGQKVRITKLLPNGQYEGEVVR